LSDVGALKGECSVVKNNGTGTAGLFGRPEHVAVERGFAEFRCGRPVLITGEGETAAAIPVDGIDDERLASFRRLVAPARPDLVITARRAQALGYKAAGPVRVALSDRDGAAAIKSWVAAADVEQRRELAPAAVAAGAAIELAKLAQRLPALLMADYRTAASTDLPLMSVSADAIAHFRKEAIDSLSIVADANIPLDGGIAARFVIFRDAIGGSSIAVIVGVPDCSKPVPVRLHSACLTGDVFGSRRCDCGDQLRLALRTLNQEGGGIILYLEQEGRGLGLANKMRTYTLQDGGLDTLDANAALGFDDDERDYGAAARMLQMLGCTRVRLLTNNPSKLEGLARAGIEIVGRIPLQGPINADNRRYLTAKATRAGHKLDHLLAVLGDGPDISK
jgi:GTP cyclohydrolase II